MEAYDEKNPNLRASTDVTIRVNRNPSAPEFNDQFYAITIPETYVLGGMVIQVIATDADGVSIPICPTADKHLIIHLLPYSIF